MKYEPVKLQITQLIHNYVLYSTFQKQNNKETNMNKIKYSALALAAMTTLSMAGGDIAPAQEASLNIGGAVGAVAGAAGAVVGSVLGENDLGANLYVGGGYTMPAHSELSTADGIKFTAGDSTGMILIGSAFNEYFGVEARWTPMDGAHDNYALYAKPEWRLTENFNIYGLIGAGKTEAKDITLQAGAGLGYDFDENWGLFADFAATDFKLALRDENHKLSPDTGFAGNAAFGFKYTF